MLCNASRQVRQQLLPGVQTNGGPSITRCSFTTLALVMYLSCPALVASWQARAAALTICLSGWGAGNLIRIVRHQIAWVRVYIYSLLKVKCDWPLMLLTLQVHLYDLQGQTIFSGFCSQLITYSII